MVNERNRMNWIAAATIIVAIFLSILMQPAQADVKNTSQKASAKNKKNIKLPPSRLSEQEQEGLLKRNPFGLDDENAIKNKAVSHNPKPVRAAKPSPPKVPVKLKLTGTIAGSKTKWAVILDKDTNKEEFYKPGDKINERSTLISVERSEAIVLVDGNRETLAINWSAQPSSARARAQAATTRSSLTHNRGRPKKPALAPGDSSVTVNKADLKKNFRNLSQLLTQMRVQPYFEQGKPAGFLVSSVRRGSFVERLGAKSGDIIRSVNGEKVDSVQKAFKLYNAFKDNSAVQVSITRKGKPVALNFTMQ